MKTLLHSFVTSRLDYCNSLLASQPDVLVQRLQSVQNAAARLYAGTQRGSHITPVLRDELHWLRIIERISFKLCTLTYKCIHGEAPEYLSPYCIPLCKIDSRISRNRSAMEGNLFVPRTKTKTYGPRSFCISGPSSWNSLPSQLKDSTIQYNSFKTQLKTHLFKISYNL